MVTEKQLQQMLLETTDNTRMLMDFCMSRFGLPVDGLLALILGSGSLAAALGMSREDLLEGVGRAWDFAQARLPKEADHVH